MPEATMTEVFKYFSEDKTNDYRLAQFRKEWGELTEQDKADLKWGIGDGSLTY